MMTSGSFQCLVDLPHHAPAPNLCGLPMTYCKVLSGPVCDSRAVRTKRRGLVSSTERLVIVLRW